MTDENHKKLELLRKLAVEASAQLDRGEGIKIRGNKELAKFINKLGRKAARRAKPRGTLE